MQVKGGVHHHLGIGIQRHVKVVNVALLVNLLKEGLVRSYPFKAHFPPDLSWLVVMVDQQLASAGVCPQKDSFIDRDLQSLGRDRVDKGIAKTCIIEHMHGLDTPISSETVAT